MAELVNEFSWSKSRAEKFSTCLRKYYLHYYASWGGWEWDTDPQTREIYVMKNLSSIPMWIGRAVHENVHWLVKRIGTWGSASREEALAKLRKDMEHDWFTSKSGEFRERPNRMLGLMEHYYNQPIDDVDFEEAYSIAESCIHDLYKRSVYNSLLDYENVKILQTEKMDTMDIDGIKVWVVADLVLNWKGRLYIVDWKTGKDFGGEWMDLQLAIYALYGSYKWNIPAEKIMVHQANLRLGQYERNKMSTEKTDWARGQINDSASQMKQLLFDPQSNIAREECFAKNDDLYHCRYCNFRRACDF